MRAVIIGASGGIGRALVDGLVDRDQQTKIHAFSRSGATFQSAQVVSGHIDILDDASIAAAANVVTEAGGADLVIVATGILSDGDAIQPEKSYRQQSFGAFERVFAINTFGPAMVARHFLPVLPKSERAVFAALTARVGSIGDNGLGGWHAYRASKAALNMLIRNYAIEMTRRNDKSICVGLHPGTVDTSLSEPFQSNVPDKQLFTAAQSAGYLLDVIDGLDAEDSGKVFDWAGHRVEIQSLHQGQHRRACRQSLCRHQSR